MFKGSTRSLTKSEVQRMGFADDARQRKRQHRRAAKRLLKSGGFFNGNSMRGTTFHAVAMWHLAQARVLAQR